MGGRSLPAAGFSFYVLWVRMGSGIARAVDVCCTPGADPCGRVCHAGVLLPRRRYDAVYVVYLHGACRPDVLPQPLLLCQSGMSVTDRSPGAPAFFVGCHPSPVLAASIRTA